MFWTDLIPENTRVSSNAHHIGVYRINSDNTQEKLGNMYLNELMEEYLANENYNSIDF